jgi:hypothetical protein
VAVVAVVAQPGLTVQVWPVAWVCLEAMVARVARATTVLAVLVAQQARPDHPMVVRVAQIH